MKIPSIKVAMAAVLFSIASVSGLWAQQVDYSVVSVPEEAGIEFRQVTTPSDYLCMPIVQRSSDGIAWFSNRIIDVSPDGSRIAFLSARNNTTNIFVKDLDKQGGSQQRTNRSAIIDFSYSPDGKYICFSEHRGETNQVFQTSATSGYVCRQMTSGAMDYSPIYSSNMKSIFFARQETQGVSIWSYDVGDNFLSTFTSGLNPYPLAGEEAYICVRANATGKSEIWKVDYGNGIEECIVSDPTRSFTSPVVSPDKQWIVMVGESAITAPGMTYRNTDIYVARIDGTQLTQLTYHAADDLSPVWGRDGRHIYFISQRGNAAGTANIWRMTFNH